MANLNSILKEKQLLKKIDSPDGFYIVVDSREQSPLFTSFICLVKKKLEVGDYSILGFENSIIVERKSVDDFYNSIGKNREQFTSNLEKIKQYEWKALVIEAPESSLLGISSLYSLLTPEQIRWSLVSFNVKYGLHIYYGKTRKDCERWIIDRFIYYYKLKRNVK